MRRNRVWFALAMLISSAGTLAVVGLSLAGGLVAGLYRGTNGLTIVMTSARATAGLALIGIVSGLGLIAVAAALVPGGWGRKTLYVVPTFLLGLMIAGGLMMAAGIGMTGTVGVGPVALPVSGVWTLFAGLATIVSVSIAAAAADVDQRIRRRAARLVAGTAAMAVISAAIIGAAAWMISTSQPSFGGEGGFARPPGGQTSGGSPAAAPRENPAPGTQPFGQARSGFPEGGDGRGRLGGAFGNVGRILPAGVGLAAILSLSGLGLALVTVRKMRQTQIGAEVTVEPVSGRVRGETARAALALCALAAATLVGIQFFAVSRTNPPVQTTIAWDSAETKDLFYRACADCHSNETTWPWYTALAPASWLTAADVNSARARFNVSEPNSQGSFGGFGNVNDIRQRIVSGTMPPSDYLLLHPEARLTDAEKQQLIQGLQNSSR